MSTSFETEQELAVFIGTVGHYFQTIGGALPDFLTPTLELELPARLACTGYMPVSGRLNGWIALSLPTTLINIVLKKLGEPEDDQNTQLDLVAEITGTLTSNAREHFGEHLKVAPPLAATAGDFPRSLAMPPLTLRLPFHWQDDDGLLLIALQR